MSLKIAMILDEKFPPDPRVEREAETLADAGHQVSIWAFSSGNKNKFAELNGIQTFYQPQSSLIRKSSALAIELPVYHLLLKKSIKKFINDVNPDVIHIHDMRIAGVVFDLVKGRKKIVLDLHENRPEIMRYYPHLRKFPGRFLVKISKWKKAEKRYASLADHLITVTKEAKKYYAPYNNSITVVTNSIDFNVYNSLPVDKDIQQKYKDTYNLLYIGDLGRRRGIKECINAVEKLKYRIPKMKLILVGHSTDLPYYKKMVEDLELKDYVDFTGYQPTALLPSYLSIADIGLCPLHRNPHHDTTFANKLFQYMAFGVPQIVSDCPAQASLIEESNCGLVFTAGDVASLSYQIEKLYSNQDLRSVFKENSISALRNTWDWSLQKNHLINLYTEIENNLAHGF